MKWLDVKEQILEDLKKANVDPNSDAGKAILKFERRVNSTRNNRDAGMHWETVCYSDSYNQAATILEDDLVSRSYSTPGQYNEEYVRYCEANGTFLEATIGDYLA